MTAAVKRVEAQFAKSGVSESCAAFERKDSQIEMRDGVKLHTIYYFSKGRRIRRKTRKYPLILTRTCYPGNDRIHRAYGEGTGAQGVMCMSTSIAAAESSRKEKWGAKTLMSGTMALTPWITLWSSHGAKS